MMKNQKRHNSDKIVFLIMKKFFKKLLLGEVYDS